jgi:hypothetical protein
LSYGGIQNRLKTIQDPSKTKGTTQLYKYTLSDKALAAIPAGKRVTAAGGRSNDAPQKGDFIQVYFNVKGI